MIPERPINPPEEPTFTVDYSTALIVENTESTATEVMTYLRNTLGKDTTIVGDHDEDGLYFTINGELEEITDDDHARDVFAGLISGSPHLLVMDGFDVTGPEADEPDWDAIAKDRRIEEEGF